MLTRIELQQYIEEHGKKQSYIAKQIGVSDSKLSKYLSGTRNLTNVEKAKLSQLTGIA